MTVVLGLDLGTEGGFARYDTVAGDLTLGRLRWNNFPIPERIILFGTWYEAILGGTLTEPDGQIIRTGLPPVEVVGFEQITFSGKGRADHIHKQEGVVQYVGRGVAWKGVSVPGLKTFATGDPHAKKPTMVAAARYGIRVLGHEPPKKLSTDPADAFLVLAWMLVNALPGWSLDGT